MAWARHQPPSTNFPLAQIQGKAHALDRALDQAVLGKRCGTGGPKGRADPHGTEKEGFEIMHDQRLGRLTQSMAHPSGRVICASAVCRPISRFPGWRTGGAPQKSRPEANPDGPFRCAANPAASPRRRSGTAPPWYYTHNHCPARCSCPPPARRCSGWESHSSTEPWLHLDSWDSSNSSPPG